MDQQYQPGDTCQVHSLQSAAAQILNGENIKIIKFLPDKQRWRCKFNDNSLKNIKSSNLDELPPRIAYYKKILQQTNETDEFIQMIVQQATKWKANGVKFDLPKGMGIQYTLKDQRPGHSVDYFPAEKKGLPYKRSNGLCVLNNVIYTLNVRRKWSIYPNNCPVGFLSDVLIHVDTMSYNSLIDNLKTIRNGDDFDASSVVFSAEYLTSCQELNQVVTKAKHEHRQNMDLNPIQQKCFHCQQKDKKMKLCSGCKSVFFCNKECMKNGWSKHKTECKKHSKASGGKSKAKALQLIKELKTLQPYQGTFKNVASFNREYTVWFFTNGRQAKLAALHELCEYKERKTFKWAIKQNVLDVFRDVILHQDLLVLRQAKLLGDKGVLCLIQRNCVNLLDILLEVPETFLPAGEPPKPDLKNINKFLGDNNGCIGFWNLIEIAECFYRIPDQPTEVQARYIVRCFSKPFANAELAQKLLPTLTKKNCKTLIWLATSFDFNPFDRSGAMQYLAMSIIACVLIQSKKFPALMPKGWNRNKWLYVPLIRKEKIFNGMVMPAFEFAVGKNRVITTDEMNGFVTRFSAMNHR